MVIKTIIVDDEPPILSEIEYLLASHPELTVMGKFDQSQQALQYVQENPVDLIFLDISMPGLSGLEFADCISALGLKTLIVFVTAYDNYALEAFATPAVGYITKPVSQAALTKTLMKVRNLFAAKLPAQPEARPEVEKAQQRISVQQGGYLKPLDSKEIIAVYVKDKECYVRTVEGEFFVNLNFTALEEILTKQDFLRVHRQYIVNLQKIEKILPWFHSTYLLKMADCPDLEIPVGRSHVQALREVLGIK